jgi:hypothetical protein
MHIYIYILFKKSKIYSKPFNHVLSYNFSKEQYMFPKDDRVIETCRSILNVLM